MDLIASQIAQLQEQSRDQAAIIVAQGNSITQLSSIVARISAENVSKDVFIRQLEAKVFPAGFWVWERDQEESETGRWAWSKDTHRNLPVVGSSKPPASFDSLPDEIIDQILFPFRYDPPTLARLSRTSRRILRIVLEKFYQRVGLSVKACASFLTSRLSSTLPKNPQLTSLLSPTNVYLYSPTIYSHNQPPDFSPLSSLPTNLPPLLNVNILSVNLQHDLSRLPHWDAVLRLFNPRQFRIITDSGADYPVVPSASAAIQGGVPNPTRATASAVVESFSSSGWDRLELVAFEGEGSVLLNAEGGTPFVWGWKGGVLQDDEPFEWTLRVERGGGEAKVVVGSLTELLEVEGLLDYNDRSVALELRVGRG